MGDFPRDLILPGGSAGGLLSEGALSAEETLLVGLLVWIVELVVVSFQQICPSRVGIFWEEIFLDED